MARLVWNFRPRVHSVFLHVPKTAGTYVQQCIDEEGLRMSKPKGMERQIAMKHATLPQLVSMEPRFRKASFYAAWVRHPVDWYVSAWRYCVDIERRRPGRRRRMVTWFDWHPFAPLVQRWSDSFEVWINSVTTHLPSYYSQLLEQYVGPAGGEFVDYIGRQETVADDVAELCGRRFPRGRVNESRQQKPTVTSAIERAIHDSEREALQRFYSSSYAKRWYLQRNRDAISGSKTFA